MLIDIDKYISLTNIGLVTKVNHLGARLNAAGKTRSSIRSDLTRWWGNGIKCVAGAHMIQPEFQRNTSLLVTEARHASKERANMGWEGGWRHFLSSWNFIKHLQLHSTSHKLQLLQQVNDSHKLFATEIVIRVQDCLIFTGPPVLSLIRILGRQIPESFVYSLLIWAPSSIGQEDYYRIYRRLRFNCVTSLN